MTNKKTIFLFLVPVFVSFILHFHVLSTDVIGYHVWRQSQTQTVIYHYTFTDHSIFHPQRFDLTNGTKELLYEFPIYQWLISQLDQCFGYSVLTSRLFTFLVFIFLLLGFYKLLLQFVNKEVALISNALLCFSPLLYYYGVNPMPDIFALCMAIWSLNFFFRYINENHLKHFIGFSLFLSLAALVKLPFILFGSVYFYHVFLLLKNKTSSQLIFKLFLFLFFLFPALLWYFYAIPTWKNNEVASGILKNDKSILQLLDYFQFNLFSTIPELITNYASCPFLVIGMYWFWKRRKQLKQNIIYFVFLFIVLSLYFFFELNQIEKVHDYYLMPFVPLVFFVVSYGLNHLYQKPNKKFIYFVLFIVPITAWIRIDGRWNKEEPGFNVDYLTETLSLQKIIPPTAQCIIDDDGSHFIALYYLKRYGFSMYEKELNFQKLKACYALGARYLVTQNLNLNLEEYSGYTFEELFNKNLKVYKIKKL